MTNQVPLSNDVVSAKIQAEDAQPEPADFKPRDNPAFILHSALRTSFGEVSYVGPKY
jgi:D-xylulose reductase